MKKFYSVILLLSFLIGTLQPILPMIEYQLHEGDILELLAHSEDIGGKTTTTICVSSNDQTSAPANHAQSLLNDNFYPVGIAILTIPPMLVFPHINKLYLPAQKNVSSPAFLPNSPPPRLS